jgi:hypothetical protein
MSTGASKAFGSDIARSPLASADGAAGDPAPVEGVSAEPVGDGAAEAASVAGAVVAPDPSPLDALTAAQATTLITMTRTTPISARTQTRGRRARPVSGVTVEGSVPSVRESLMLVNLFSVELPSIVARALRRIWLDFSRPYPQYRGKSEKSLLFEFAGR